MTKKGLRHLLNANAVMLALEVMADDDVVAIEGFRIGSLVPIVHRSKLIIQSALIDLGSRGLITRLVYGEHSNRVAIVFMDRPGAMDYVRRVVRANGPRFQWDPIWEEVCDADERETDSDDEWSVPPPRSAP